ncbi:hypothetical protein [Paludibacter sp.]|uniref:hypothetical protein n=1 Tax=Paludibacter sp. TaxID=1898105 RepID=UPI0013543776|nr:hypothetical protein [Paludibacter sp.]MTK54550.1 hypothetical protein [Paludibacter sp.]
MKQMFRYVTITLLAGVVFLVGSGVNYIHYCCHECSIKGIGEIAKELCMANQPVAPVEKAADADCCSAKHSTPKPMSCGHMSHTGTKDCCKITRLQIDLNDQIAKISVNADFTWHVDLPNSQLLSAIFERPVVTTEHVCPPPLYSSRHLLSLKSVLLI